MSAKAMARILVAHGASSSAIGSIFPRSATRRDEVGRLRHVFAFYIPDERRRQDDAASTAQRMDRAMTPENEVRRGERVAEWSGRTDDAGLVYVGRIRTPWHEVSECPRHGRIDGPLCRIEVFETWVPALRDLAEGSLLEVLYWLHRSRRDLLLQSPRDDGTTRSVFSIRSPLRPNPIGTSIARLERREGSVLFVRGLDCLDGTPLLDLKPDRSDFVPLAPPTAGDMQVGDP